MCMALVSPRRFGCLTEGARACKVYASPSEYRSRKTPNVVFDDESQCQHVLKNTCSAGEHLNVEVLFDFSSVLVCLPTTNRAPVHEVELC